MSGRLVWRVVGGAVIATAMGVAAAPSPSSATVCAETTAWSFGSPSTAGGCYSLLDDWISPCASAQYTWSGVGAGVTACAPMPM